MVGQSPRLDRMSKNLIINGNFDFWQRGTSFSASPFSGYVSDRWRAASNSGNTTCERMTDSPNNLSSYSMKWEMNLASSLSASTYMSFEQKIEGNFIGHVTTKAGSTTIGAWLKCSKVGVRNITLRSNPASGWANNRTYVAKVTIAQADTWEFHPVVIDFDGAGLWAKDETVGLYLSIPLRAGSDYHVTSTDQWEVATSGEFSSSDLVQLNDLDDYLMVAQVQLLEGNINLDGSTYAMAGRDYAEELRLCERYYEYFDERIYGSAATASYAHWYFKSEKRDVPAISGTAYGATTADYISTKRVRFLRSGDTCGWIDGTADAEL